MKPTIERVQEIVNFGFWELDFIHSKLLWSNQVFKIFGKDPSTFTPSYESFLDCVHADDREMVTQAFELSLQNKQPYSVEHRIVLDDNSIRYVSEQCETEFDQDGNPVRSIGSVQDVTQRSEVLKKLMESEHKFKAISNQTTEGITLADMDGNYVFVNPAFCSMSGYSEEELLNLTVFDMKAKNQDRGSFKESKEKMEGKPLRVNLQRKDGTEYFTEIIGNVIKVDESTFVLGTIRDITNQVKYELEITSLNQTLESKIHKRTKDLDATVKALNEEINFRSSIEKELIDSLKTKEILLREITHRVKNNMQIISSLINLQRNSLREVDASFLDEINHRIHSMALIHETLSKTKEYKHVKFQAYTHALISHIKGSYETDNIEIQTIISDSQLPLDIATNCGMILMELITNAIKYAFIDQPSGIIKITFEEHKPGVFLLEVADNGKGFPKEINFRNCDSLGLQLVVSLAEQINGRIEQFSDAGTKYHIQF